MGENPYHILKVPRDATPDEIKNAYRRRAQEVHPDRNPGHEDEMTAVNAAYALLSDPEKRDALDRFGDEVKMGLINDLGILMNKVLDQMQDVEHYDPIKATYDSIVATRGGFQAQLEGQKDAIKKREKVIKRTKRKKNGNNLIVSILERDIDERQKKCMELRDIIDHGTALLKLLEEFEYTLDGAGPAPRYISLQFHIGPRPA